MYNVDMVNQMKKQTKALTASIEFENNSPILVKGSISFVAKFILGLSAGG